MKRLLFVLVLSLGLISCAEEKSEINHTIVQGRIQNPTADTITIRAGDFLAEIPLAGDGTFRDTLDLREKGYYTLRVGGEITTMYLTPGNDLQVSLDTEQFDETVRYAGDNAAENNYLAQKFLLSEQLEVPQDQLKEMPEDSLVLLSDAHERRYLDLLQRDEHIDSAFLATEKKALAYGNLYTRQLYSVLNKDRYYGPDSTSTAVLFDGNTDLDNAEDYEDFQDYRNLVNLDFFKHTSIFNSQDTSSYEDLAFAYIEKVRSENIRNHLLERVSFGIRPGSDRSGEIYDRVMALSTDEAFKDQLRERYATIRKLDPGNPSPTFTYENHKGGETSLESLKGKYVYLDIWATWCGPCLRQIPALKEVEEDYKDKNIHFVSISIDTEAAYDKWKKMVTEKDLGGIQLIADNAWNSEFIQDYAINGIPRFILLDPQGNIVSADAPRPTDPALRELFENLKI